MLRAVAKDQDTEEVADDAQRGFGRGQGSSAATGSSGSQTVSVLGGGMTVTGDVTGDGELRIEGRVEGGIEAGEVVASGKVSGKISAKGAVRLKKGCKVDADVQAAAVELEEGGILNGRIEMKSAG
jgi:cytoskeletal protein CcmA (bactofilin family)